MAALPLEVRELIAHIIVGVPMLIVIGIVVLGILGSNRRRCIKVYDVHRQVWYESCEEHGMGYIGYHETRGDQ